MSLVHKYTQGNIEYTQKEGYSGWVSEETVKLEVGDIRLINGGLCAAADIRPNPKQLLKTRTYRVTWHEQNANKMPHDTSRMFMWGSTPSKPDMWKEQP